MPHMRHPDGRHKIVPPHSVGRLTREGFVSDDAPATPSETDLKATWIDHAVNQGVDRHAAEAMTKAELVARYG